MRTSALLLLVVLAYNASAQELYEMPLNKESRLSSFENPNGIKGQGGKTNKMAKGNAFEWIKPGESKIL